MQKHEQIKKFKHKEIKKIYKLNQVDNIAKITPTHNIFNFTNIFFIVLVHHVKYGKI